MIRPALAALLLASAAACAPATAAIPTIQYTPAPGQHVSAQVPSGCHVIDGRADTRCTPGVRNPQVTQANIATTICKSGWTATIRPPVTYTNAQKARDIPLYGETGPPSAYELDHLIPLELGGNPTDPGNLWPEAWDGPRGAHVKDQAETSLKRAVCGGRLKLADAQAAILRDWTHP